MNFDTERVPAPSGHAPRLDAIQADDGVALMERENADASLFSDVTVDVEEWR